MAELVEGRIIGADADGLTVRIPYRNWQRFTKRGYERVICELPDERSKTNEQNRLIWALMTEIGLWAGYRKSQVEQRIYREYFAPRFALDILPTLRKRAYRISTSTEEEASAFISMLIDFCIENNVPTSQPLQEMSDDIWRYVYSCLMHKRCAICGKKCDLHHVDRVGMGRDRTEINHIGMECLPLCREHHSEAHTMPDMDFMSKYHITPVRIDDAIQAKYGLTKGV